MLKEFEVYQLPRESSLAGVPRWGTLDEAIRHYAAVKPDGWAYIEPSGRLSWSAYDGYVSILAAALVEAGVGRGERVAVWLPDGCAVHVALSACLRAGVVYTGIGARCGERELRHLLAKSGARHAADGAGGGRAGHGGAVRPAPGRAARAAAAAVRV